MVTTRTVGGTVVTFPPQNAPGTTAPGEPGDIGRVTASIPATTPAERPAPPVHLEPRPGPGFGSLAPPQPILFSPAAVPREDQTEPDRREEPIRAEQGFFFDSSTSELSAGGPVVPAEIDLRAEPEPEMLPPDMVAPDPVDPSDEYEDDENLEALLAELSAATGQPSPPTEFAWDLAPPIDDIRFEPPAAPITASAPLVGPQSFVDPVSTREVPPRVESADEPAFFDSEPEVTGGNTVPGAPTVPALLSEPPVLPLPTVSTVRPAPPNHREPPIFESRSHQEQPGGPTIAHRSGGAEKSRAEAFASETSLLPARTRRGDVKVASAPDGGSWFDNSGELPIIRVGEERKAKRKRRLFWRFLRRLVTGLMVCVILGAALFAALSTVYI